MNDKEYILVMFPYPSGNGLHIGHAYNYAIIDSYCRWKKMKGIEVFQPFGYDAFGLPAEMYAEKVGRAPEDVTQENIENFRRQMKRMNTQYEEKLITSDPSYYKWTQWLFTKLYEKGLAYKKKAFVNWDPVLKTVLANEQVKDGISERSGAKVEQKELEQWFFKITDYKDRLIKNLDWIDYPKSTIAQQRHWLENLQDWCVSRQRKWGCPIPIEGEEDTLDTFVCSSFYYLRYLDSENENELVSPEKYKQVDLYVGGNEHACMHLIYARFINMFLYDIGIAKEEEPFKKLIHQGMITHQGEKMSKTKGNVVNPDNYDPDELRLYLMFIGHYFDGGDWDDSKIKGIRRFIGRFTKWLENCDDDADIIDTTEFEEKINNYVESFKFNKVISTFMEFYNKHKNTQLSTCNSLDLREMFSCFAPNFEVFKNEELHKNIS
jgi:leucyl-tRNA synthetase